MAVRNCDFGGSFSSPEDPALRPDNLGIPNCEGIASDAAELEGSLALRLAGMPDRGAFAGECPLLGVDEHRGRVVKQWGTALGITPEAMERVLEHPDFRYLHQLFHLDQWLRSVGGSYVITVDPERRFEVKILSTPGQIEKAQRAAEAILPSDHFEALSQASTFVALVHDVDRMPRNIDDVSQTRFRKEVTRSMRDEVFPTIISGMLGELGLPSGRGSHGFDLLCRRGREAGNVGGLEDVQVKVLSASSPIFNRESVQGKKQFFKIVHLLTFEPESGVEPKALFMQHTASDQQIQELVDDLEAAGVRRDRIVVLERSRLNRAGVSLGTFEVADDANRREVVQLRIDLQQSLRREWALHTAADGGPVFQRVPPLYDTLVNGEYVVGSLRDHPEEPLELAIMRANGTLPLVEYFLAREGRVSS